MLPTIHFKSYATAIKTCAENIEACLELAKDCTASGHYDIAAKVMEQRKDWIKLLYVNLREINEPLFEKIINEPVLSVSENISQSGPYESLHEAHAVAVTNNLS